MLLVPTWCHFYWQFLALFLGQLMCRFSGIFGMTKRKSPACRGHKISIIENCPGIPTRNIIKARVHWMLTVQLNYENHFVRESRLIFILASSMEVKCCLLPGATYTWLMYVCRCLRSEGSGCGSVCVWACQVRFGAVNYTHPSAYEWVCVCVCGRGAKGVSQDTWKTWETLIAGLRAASFVISSSSDFELVIKLDCTYCQLPDFHPLPPSSTS